MAQQQTAQIVDLAANAAQYVDAQREATIKRATWHTRIEQREKQLARLKAHPPEHVSWLDMLIEPIKAGLESHYPDCYFEVYGPFGMSATTSIHGVRRLPDGSGSGAEFIGSLTFRPADLGHGAISLVDYSLKVRDYAPGTIGEMNGLNYGVKPLPETFEGLCHEFDATVAANQAEVAALVEAGKR